MRYIGFTITSLILGILIVTGCGQKPRQHEAPMRTIVFFGNSLTYGYGVDREKDSFYARIERIMQSGIYENVRTVNAGRTGDTTADALERMQADVLAHNPDIVVIEFGLNDCQTSRVSRNAFRANIETMIRRMPAGTDVVLATANTFMDTGGDRWRGLNESLDVFMDEIRDIARERDIDLIDVNRAWKSQIREDLRNMESLYADPSHPSAKGHGLIYNLYMNVLRRKLVG